jgi:hypothetical protein
MLWAAMSVKLITEIALFAWLGRSVLSRWLGTGAQSNPFWRVLDWLVQPFERLAARSLPTGVSPARRPVWTLAGLVGLWLVATAVKVQICAGAGVAACR